LAWLVGGVEVLGAGHLFGDGRRGELTAGAGSSQTHGGFAAMC
jgi:hypothetical protein